MKKTSELKETLKKGAYKDLLLDIYADESKIEYQTERYIKAIEKFEELYGEGEAAIYSAPGRSEVGGNHTDHQHGEILAASINLDAIAITRKTDDNTIRLISGTYKEIVIDVNNLDYNESERETTKALIKGVLKGAEDHGFAVGGFTAYVTSDVLIGAGLSSSAAFETVVGTIISNLYNDGKMDAVTIAIIGQYAENVYFGKPCGLMDQMACSVGSLVHVNFAKPKEPVVEKVNFDMNKYGYSLCITDTKGSHADLTADYAAVPQEMKAVAAYFGKEVLLEVTMNDIIENMAEIREKCGDRAVLRAIHFVNENKRVRKESEALKAEKIDEFLKLVEESGDSSYKYLQNVYTVNDIRHQNVSLALAISDTVLKDGKGVCRVHGGGFAGTIQAFVKNEAVSEYLEKMDKIFGKGACSVLKIRKYGGMKVID